MGGVAFLERSTSEELDGAEELGRQGLPEVFGDWKLPEVVAAVAVEGLAE